MINKVLKAKIIEHFGVQGDFAQALSIQESLISRVVHGRKELSELEKLRWAKALDCRPEEIFEAKE